MQIIAPDYYENFKCIAGECKNSCCIGWEIDVDDETLEIYKNITGELGERLKKGISYEGGTPHFITDNMGRCPFLNKNGLCDIISAVGEDGLCQICYDHPRFHNYFSDRVEIGLGLCCEAATGLILGDCNKLHLTVLEDDGEKNLSTDDEATLFIRRKELFEIFQNRRLSIKSRMEQAAEFYGLPLTSPDIKSLIKIYRSLERLDAKWDEFLNIAEEKNYTITYILALADEKISLPVEKLLCYFTYRYFASAESPRAAVKFILQNTLFCLALCLSCCDEPNFEKFSEICRKFSLEVEYSEENVVLLLKG